MLFRLRRTSSNGSNGHRHRRPGGLRRYETDRGLVRRVGMWEFHDALNRLYEDHKRFIALIERMPPLSDAQKQRISEMLVRQSQDYDRIKSKGEIARRVWKAARQATREVDPDGKQDGQWSGWRPMVIALVVVGAILVFLKLVLHR